jgi:hypothetical protein
MLKINLETEGRTVLSTGKRSTVCNRTGRIKICCTRKGEADMKITFA